MKDYLIVDGYNVINAWKEFASVRESSLEHARDMLVAAISEYAAFRGRNAVIVFDAQSTPGSVAEENLSGVRVIFTQEGATADSWIESFVCGIRGSGAGIFVVTSDYAEQLHVLGAGAYRISAREFREEYLQTKREIAAGLKFPADSLNRNELGDRVNGRVLEHLEILRRSKRQKSPEKS